jgi:peroxiredoxin
MSGLLHRTLTASVLATLVATSGSAATVAVPAVLRDVTSARVDVAALARGGHLVFVTVKATWCPICREQLQRLGRLLPRLRACGASFVVLVPGTDEAVAAVARDTSFPYPFVADGAVALAATVGFAADAEELMPGFFAVNADREVVWRQRGRAAGAFGDGELMRYLGCKGPSAGDLLARLD